MKRTDGISQLKKHYQQHHQNSLITDFVKENEFTYFCKSYLKKMHNEIQEIEKNIHTRYVSDKHRHSDADSMYMDSSYKDSTLTYHAINPQIHCQSMIQNKNFKL